LAQLMHKHGLKACWPEVKQVVSNNTFNFVAKQNYHSQVRTKANTLKRIVKNQTL